MILRPNGWVLISSRTNNGVIHILDKVMSPLNASSTNGSPSATTSGGASPTKTNAANGLFVNEAIVALVALMSAVFLI
jgi:hypothetical protein